jgi:3-isopropylmalate dehydrogenase
VESDSDEIAYQIGMISREGTRRVIKYAFDLAMVRRKHLSSVDKANVLSDIYGFWREEFEATAAQYPEVSTDFNFVDAITMWFVKIRSGSTSSSPPTCSATSSATSAP